MNEIKIKNATWIEKTVLIEVDNIPFNWKCEGTVRELLENLDMFINMNGFAPPDYYDYNEIGREAQKIYDGIYEKNCM